MKDNRFMQYFGRNGPWMRFRGVHVCIGQARSFFYSETDEWQARDKKHMSHIVRAALELDVEFSKYKWRWRDIKYQLEREMSPIKD